MKVNKTIISLIAFISVSGVTKGSLTNLTPDKVQAVTFKSDEIQYSAQSGDFFVSYIPGYAIAVYEKPAVLPKPTGQTLPHGSAWKVSRQALVGGKWYYQVGKNQWVQATYMSRKQPEISTASNLGGTMYVNYEPNASIAVYEAPANLPKPNGQYLKHGTAWKVFQQVTTSNGKSYIKVGENQWVQANYMSQNQPEIIASSALSGTMYVNYKNNASIAVFSRPANYPALTQKYLPHGSGWRVFRQVTTSNGRRFIQVGNGQWVQADYMSWNKPIIHQQQSYPQQSNPAVQSPSRVMVATAYDPRVLGNYTFGYDTVAANLNVFPRGTKLQITFRDGTTKNYVVRDTGGFAAANPNQLDIAMPNAQAIQFGRQTITVRVIN